MEKGEFQFLELPLELKRRVASFLATRDAVNMTRSCRTLHRNLALTHLEPVRPVFTTYRRSGQDNNWYRACRIPVLNKRVHSLRLEFFWRDQGWGNRKGECRVVGFPPGVDPPVEVVEGSEFEGGHIVCMSAIAAHDEERLRLTFSPMDDEVYIFYYKVGEGGGHELVMRDGALHTVIFDDEHRNFSNNYRILFEEGVLCRLVVVDQPRAPETTSLFFPRMLISVSRALRRQLQDDIKMNEDLPRTVAEEELEAFLAEYSIPLNLGSLVALEEIVNADIEERLVRKNELQREQAPNHVGGEQAFPPNPFIFDGAFHIDNLPLQEAMVFPDGDEDDPSEDYPDEEDMSEGEHDN
mmetsp:Transcript_20691/g.26709  ORF Transcript_20691/g.26709 Transcript_20691/m.26709 type:complete len:353 (-) Transcript_20691:209-1267(-)|eukprot:CAMPEP_0198145852 /NCGR_PEP_ID=MMETSP1443-20131203/25742_1 /TAXON_ID=186043 /ORGANISM="Entomoneis sp., Strain CCMP2396" /LENGTH=352 /DNA_ID=CAMNT_0043809599 /DNA_START=45 /DNA_END=1103 /DNA_ORIENTATION=+